MNFLRTSDWQAGIEHLTQKLHTLLVDNKVLWLIPGGSNISASVAIMDRLDDSLTSNLTTLLTDERYGLFGHPNSNATQLLTAGFKNKLSTNITVLTPANLSLEETAKSYNQKAINAFKSNDIVIGQFGIGTDGHIAGILPHSPATTSTNFVEGYNANEFIRLTLTFEALRQINIAYAFVFGDNKQIALDRLHDEEISTSDQPAQILKKIPEVYIFSDQIQIGDRV